MAQQRQSKNPSRGKPPRAPRRFAGGWVYISGKIMTVRGKISFNAVWTCAACLVLLAQVNLLWVAAVHRHEEEAFRRAPPPPPAETCTPSRGWRGACCAPPARLCGTEPRGRR